MKNILDFIKRNVLWLLAGGLAFALINPSIAEIKTLFLIVVIESLALALSGLAVYVYTKIDFTKESAGNNLGLIFLGVNICVGLTVLGVYIAQF
jgi:hypothetical protein